MKPGVTGSTRFTNDCPAAGRAGRAVAATGGNVIAGRDTEPDFARD